MLFDPCLRALADELWRGQRRLKRAARSEVFQLYLRIEEVENQRLIALAERVWAVARASDASGRRVPAHA